MNVQVEARAEALAERDSRAFGALETERCWRCQRWIWEAFLVEHSESERLPAILPVVVHHSPRGWTAATDLCSLIDADPDTLALIAGYIPQFRFVLDDLSHADDGALRGRSLTAVAAAGLMLLGRGRAPHLLEELRRWSNAVVLSAEIKLHKPRRLTTPSTSDALAPAVTKKSAARGRLCARGVTTSRE